MGNDYLDDDAIELWRNVLALPPYNLGILALIASREKIEELAIGIAKGIQKEIENEFKKEKERSIIERRQEESKKPLSYRLNFKDLELKK